MPKCSYHQLLQWVTTNTCKHLWKVRYRSKSRVLFCSESEWALKYSEVSEEIATNWNPTRRRMARERRGASSFVVSIKTIYYTTIYWRCFIGRREEQYQDHILQDNSLHRILRIAFTHRTFYTQKLLHTDAFTHRSFYTQTLLHTDAFTHNHFLTHRLLHPNFASCDRVAADTKKSQFYISFWHYTGTGQRGLEQAGIRLELH